MTVEHRGAGPGRAAVVASRSWRPLLAGGIVVAVVVVLVIWWGHRDDDRPSGASSVAGPPPSGMVIDLQRLGPGDGSVLAGSSVPLFASAGGQRPIAALELWADGVLVERVDVDGEQLGVRRDLEWSATPGEVALSARSIDVDGRTALSDVVWIDVADRREPDYGTVVEHDVTAGETLETIAARYDVAENVLVLANPGGFDADGAPTGSRLLVPLSVDPADVPTGPVGFRSAIRNTASAPITTTPAPVVRVADCTAIASWDRSTPPLPSISAHLLVAGSNAFGLVASGSGGATLSVPLPAGTSRLVLATFDEAVTSYTAPVVVDAGTDCDEGWSGDARLRGQTLVVPGAAESAFLYLSDGSGWARVPGSGEVPRGPDGFDFTGLLPDLGTSEVDIVAWGRHDGSVSELGRGHRAAGAATWAVVPPLVRTQLWWVEAPASGSAPEQLSTGGFAPPGVLTFRWKASTTTVTRATWQVVAYHPPAGAGLDLPGVLAQDTVLGSEGTFTIDFAKLTGKPPVSTASASAALAGLAGAGAAIVPISGASPISKGSAAPVVAIGASGATSSGGTELSSTAVNLLLPPPTRFFVRMLPFIGDQYVGRPSTTVTIDTEIEIDSSIFGKGPIGQPGSNVYSLALSIVPPSTPNPWMAKCWTITGIDFTKFDPQYSYLYPWMVYLQSSQYGATVCPVCYKAGSGSIDFAGYYGWHCDTGGGFDLTDPSTWDEFPIIGPLVTTLVQVGISVWDFVVEIATYLKAKVVDLVSFVGCESFVNVGSAAVGAEAPSEASDWCHTLAEIAVDAALVSAGIPPTLPSFEELMQQAEEGLVEAIIAQAVALGVPCEESELVAQASGEDTLSCEGLAEALVDKVVETTKEAVTASAQSTSGIFFPPGVSAVPHPNGLEQPPQVSITVTPKAGAPSSGITCPATVVMTSSHTPKSTVFGRAKMPDLNVGYDKNYGMTNGLWLDSKPYGGWVIEPTSIDLPTLPVTGGKPAPATGSYTLHRLLAHDPIPADTYWGWSAPSTTPTPSLHLEIPYASVQVHPGATLTTTVHSACASDTTVTGIVLPDRKLLVTKTTS